MPSQRSSWQNVVRLCYRNAIWYQFTRKKRIARELNELDADELLQLTESDMQARYALEGRPAQSLEEASYWERLEYRVEMEALEAEQEAAMQQLEDDAAEAEEQRRLPEVSGDLRLVD